jgi:hypothetical protein
LEVVPDEIGRKEIGGGSIAKTEPARPNNMIAEDHRLKAFCMAKIKHKKAGA